MNPTDTMGLVSTMNRGGKTTSVTTNTRSSSRMYYHYEMEIHVKKNHWKLQSRPSQPSTRNIAHTVVQGGILPTSQRRLSIATITIYVDEYACL